MNTPFDALTWELVWKNRVVFPALLLILAFGAVMAGLVSHADPEIWWSTLARGAALIAFLASVLLAYASFSLMESHEGWRMNSMTTRWFALPVRTAALVATPLILAWLLLTLLIVAWSPILGRTIPGLNMLYILLVLLTGSTATQALAWALPRRPGQFWLLAAIVFAVTLILTLAAGNLPFWANSRTKLLGGLGLAVFVLILLARWAAGRNRCGDWPGEIPSLNLLGWRSGGRRREFASASGALLWSDSWPLLRSFVLSWLAVSCLLTGYVWFLMKLRQPHLSFDAYQIIWRAGLDLLPPLGVLWLAGFGLFLGCEPGAGFRTRLSSYRATLPVASGRLAAVRIGTLVLAWGCVWAPLLGLHLGYQGDYRGIPPELAERMALQESAGLAFKMAVGLHVLVGALPLFLLGRWEGFPTLLLVGMSSWAWTYLLVWFLDVDDNPGRRWIMVGLLCALKFGGAGWALARACRSGQATWRWAAALTCAWLLVAGSLIWAFPIWQTGGAWRGAAVVLLVPLARLSWSPLAVGWNRCR